MKPSLLLPLGLAFAAVLPTSGADRVLHIWKKLQLENYYWSEGANFGDVNHDGKPDAISGPYWWEGPAFTQRHEFYPATTTFTVKRADGTEERIPGFEGAFGKRNSYSGDNFFTFVHDFNGDGWNDILTYGLPGTPAYLYLNPKGAERHWERHTVFDAVDNESPTFADVTGDGKPEILCNSGGTFGYASPDWSNPTAKWPFISISGKGPWGNFNHGLGIGDVNGDGYADLLVGAVPVGVATLFWNLGVAAGLVGAITVARRGQTNADGTPKDVDRELFALFAGLNENQSWYADQNIAAHISAADRQTLNQHDNVTNDLHTYVLFTGKGFAETNFKFSVNGYLYGNGPVMTMTQGQRVRWYLMDVGDVVNFHTPHWLGHLVTYHSRQTDVFSMLPAGMETADMKPDAPGSWVLRCQVDDHNQAGMWARYEVLPAQGAAGAAAGSAR